MKYKHTRADYFAFCVPEYAKQRKAISVNFLILKSHYKLNTIFWLKKGSYKSLEFSSTIDSSRFGANPIEGYRELRTIWGIVKSFFLGFGYWA